MSASPTDPITTLLDRLPPDAAAICERWDLDLCVLGRREPDGERLLFVSVAAGPGAGYRIHADPGPAVPGVLGLEASLRVIGSRLRWGGGREGGAESGALRSPIAGSAKHDGEARH